MKSSDLEDAKNLLLHRAKLLQTIDWARRPVGFGRGFSIAKPTGGYFFITLSEKHSTAFAAIVSAIEAEIAECTADLARIGVTIVPEGEPSSYEQEQALKRQQQFEELTGAFIAAPPVAAG